jgi:uncharacterized protein HemX
MSNLIQNLFGKKEPTIQQVDKELSRLDDQRAQLQARSGALEVELTAAYGDTVKTDALLQESHTITLKLKQLQQVRGELELSRQDAARREFLEAYRARCAALAEDVVAIRALTATRREAEAVYRAALRDENDARRAYFQAQHDLTRNRQQEAAAHGVTVADLQAIEREFSDLENSVAQDAGEYDVMEFGGLTHDSISK